MASIILSSSQKEFKNKFDLCNAYFAIKEVKGIGLYCPGTYNLKAPILTPKQFAYSKR